MTGIDLPDHVLDLVYAAPLEPDRWPAVLGEIVVLAGGNAGLLVADAPAGNGPAVVASVGLRAEPLSTYCARGLHHDVMIRATFDRPAGTLLRDGDVMPHARFLRTELATLLLAPHGLDRVIGGAVRLGASGYAAIWLYRRDRLFDHGPAAILRALVGHLRRALEIHRRVEVVRQRVASADAVLDRLAVAAVMVDGNGRPVGCNRTAAKLARRGDGFGLRDDGLVGSTASTTRQLRETIADALKGDAVHPPAERGVALERPSRRRPLEVIVVPIATGGGPDVGERVSGVVFIIDPDAAPATSERIVQELFGLTPAEARLAVHLLQGEDLATAAEAIGVTRNTAQTQLAAIFRKTGTGRQAELVRLLTRGPAAVRSIEESSGFWPRGSVRSPL